MTANTVDFLDELAKKDPKAAERLRKAEAAHDKANGHAKEEAPNTGQEGAAEPPPAERIRTINFAELKGRTPPPRRFIVDQWIPAGCVTSLYGPGGIGKTLLAQ